MFNRVVIYFLALVIVESSEASLLHLAIRSREPAAIQLLRTLLAHYPKFRSQTDEKGRTLSDVALEVEELELFDYLQELEQPPETMKRNARQILTEDGHLNLPPLPNELWWHVIENVPSPTLLDVVNMRRVNRCFRDGVDAVLKGNVRYSIKDSSDLIVLMLHAYGPMLPFVGVLDVGFDEPLLRGIFPSRFHLKLSQADLFNNLRRILAQSLQTGSPRGDIAQLLIQHWPAFVATKLRLKCIHTIGVEGSSAWELLVTRPIMNQFF